METQTKTEYQFPNYETVAGELERGRDYRGFYRGKSFTIRLNNRGMFEAAIYQRHTIRRDELRKVMDELRRDIQAMSIMGSGFVG
jgi:hypothetical protein